MLPPPLGTLLNSQCSVKKIAVRSVLMFDLLSSYSAGDGSTDVKFRLHGASPAVRRIHVHEKQVGGCCCLGEDCVQDTQQRQVLVLQITPDCNGPSLNNGQQKFAHGLLLK